MSGNDINSEIKSIRLKLAKNYAEQKKLMARLHELLELESDVDQFEENHFEPVKVKVPESLKDLLGIEKKRMTSSEIRNCLYEYIEENELLDKKKRTIKTNRELRKVFSLSKEDTLDFYNLQVKLCELLE